MGAWGPPALAVDCSAVYIASETDAGVQVKRCVSGTWEEFGPVQPGMRSPHLALCGDALYLACATNSGAACLLSLIHI